MKQFLLSLIVVLSSLIQLSAQTVYQKDISNQRFSIKAQPFVGFYVDKSSNIEAINPHAPMGVNIALEFPSMQQRPWQQYLNNPTAGIGMTYMDFGADMMGMTVAVYPYLMLNVIRAKHFEMKVRLASGLAVVSEHWYTQDDTDPDHYGDATTNTTFGCYLNAYLSAGLNMDFPITRNFAINTEFGFTHMSNGRTFMPNVGANIFYGGVGLVKTFNPEVKKTPVQFPDLPYEWSLNITGASGFQTPDVGDRKFLIASLHTGAICNINNWYGLGPGIDVFYNGAVNKESSRNLFRKDIDYTTLDKMRVGLALNNEFRFGEITAIFDWGVYFFNPSRNYYINAHPVYGYGKRPLFYRAQRRTRDDGCHYFRFGLKYRVWDNLYLQATAKTHLQIAEFIEFGIGYQIPFLRKERRTEGKNIIYHRHNKWWLD